MPQIAWNLVGTNTVTDGLGRTFNWSSVKGATIFLCGHGAHMFRDGYCAVPSNTTVNFYQTYGRLMVNFHAIGFIRGKTDQLTRERSFIAGQSCPDMTLFDDDDSELGTTNAALKDRIQSDPNCYVFNTNQFDGLDVYQEATPHPFNGKKTLRLSQIMSVLKGNTLEWMCCQELMGWRQHAVPGQAKLLTVVEQRRAAAAAGATRVEERRKRFSDKVQAGLRAADWTAGETPGAQGTSSDAGFDVQLGQTPHSEGAGGTRYAPVQWLNKARTGAALKPDPANRAGVPRGQELQTANERTRVNLLRWQADMANGLNALNIDPQPNASMEERVWAKVTLERGLTRLAILVARLTAPIAAGHG